jgi:hypothetical protein
MQLPNFQHAVLDLAKLRSYSLDPHHIRGGNKARVFRAALGMDESHAEWLRDQILESLPGAEAKIGMKDHYGTRYSADITIRRQNRETLIRTGWIIRWDENFPRFTSAWVR